MDVALLFLRYMALSFSNRGFLACQQVTKDDDDGEVRGLAAPPATLLQFQPYRIMQHAVLGSTIGQAASNPNSSNGILCCTARCMCVTTG